MLPFSIKFSPNHFDTFAISERNDQQIESSYMSYGINYDKSSIVCVAPFVHRFVNQICVSLLKSIECELPLNLLGIDSLEWNSLCDKNVRFVVKKLVQLSIRFNGV